MATWTPQIEKSLQNLNNIQNSQKTKKKDTTQNSQLDDFASRRTGKSNGIWILGPRTDIAGQAVPGK